MTHLSQWPNQPRQLTGTSHDSPTIGPMYCSLQMSGTVQDPEKNYCCQWLVLLCILGWLLQAKQGHYECLPKVGGQKRNPQIDGTYKVKNLHIQFEENLFNYLMHYYQIKFTSQPVLVTGNLNLHVYCVANESQFMCICNHPHVICHLYHSDLSKYTGRFAVIFMCICHYCHSKLS